jgi:anti-anti-sigma factor
VAYVAGEVDMLTGPALRSHLDQVLATRPEHLIVDLSQVSFLGSTGLAVLINVQEAAIHQGTTFQLRGVRRAAGRVLQVTTSSPSSRFCQLRRDPLARESSHLPPGTGRSAFCAMLSLPGTQDGSWITRRRAWRDRAEHHQRLSARLTTRPTA